MMRSVADSPVVGASGTCAFIGEALGDGSWANVLAAMKKGNPPQARRAVRKDCNLCSTILISVRSL